MCTMECSVTATGYNTIDAMLTQLLGSLDTSVWLKEIWTTRRLQDRATTINRIGCTNAIEHLEVPGYHSRVATDNANDLEATLLGSSLNSTNVGIHAWCVAATGKHCDTFHTPRKYDRKPLSMTEYSSFPMLRKGNGSVTKEGSSFAPVTIG